MPATKRAATQRTPSAAEQRYLDLTEPLLGRAGVTRSTMMGLPCMRMDGTFFASFDHRTDDLLIKLSEAQADALVATGKAHAFAPAGRRFREWAAVPPTSRSWAKLIDAAVQHVSTATK